MKIVQSLWSKPGKDTVRQNFAEINRCGWPSKKYNYISWALSCLQFRKYYEEVELVTDKAGYELLINKMELPYTSAKIVLDDLNDYPADLYALGKIYAYNIQDKPFIHADGDVFIWDRFEKDFEGASLLGQNAEDGADHNRWYASMFVQVVENFNSYPGSLDRSITRNNRIVAVNAGILGGNNISFFKDYAKEAFRFVDRNKEPLSKIDIKSYNLILEQFLFHAMSEDYGEKIRYFNPDFVRIWHDISDFMRIPSKTRYIHTLGGLKRLRHTVDAMEYRLQNHHVGYYYKLINLLRTNQI